VFDARFRPWYSIAATGPKDVIIVIDISGSMQTYSGSSSRMDLAKTAALKVLDTLSK
jgi:Mg-chelatase subunit ChlD